MQPTGSIVEATSGLFEQAKTGKNEEFNWTPKRRAALDYLIQARGNVRVAAELSKRGPVSVSFAYLSDLKYSAKYKPFREEYQRRTGDLLNALEVDTEYIVRGYVELTRPDIPPSTRRQALRDLGEYVGIWDRKRKEGEPVDWWKEALIRAIKEEPDPERREQVIQAVEVLAGII